MRLEQSRRAKADLDDIRNYSVAQFGSDRAIAYLDAIETVFRLIVDHPMAGAPSERFGSAIRSAPCQSHRIFYEVIGERIVILRVLHKAMDIQRHL